MIYLTEGEKVMKRSGIALALALAAVWTASADVEVWLMRREFYC